MDPAWSVPPPPLTPSPAPAQPPARRREPALTTYVLIALNLAVWSLITSTGGELSPWLERLALTPAMHLPTQWVTSAFTHLSVTHVAFNMVALYSIGPALEAFLGRARYLTIYVVSMLTASACVVLLSDPWTMTIGASGAVFGLMGTYLVIALRTGRGLQGALFWLGVNLAFTLLPGISWQGHLGGLLGGVATSLVLTRGLRRLPRP